MGATHLPSTEFDGTGMDDQLEAEAEAQLGAPAEPMVQLLDPDGTLGSDPVFSKYAEKLDPDTLRGFYADMAKIRRFDVEATALQRQGELGREDDPGHTKRTDIRDARLDAACSHRYGRGRDGTPIDTQCCFRPNWCDPCKTAGSSDTIVGAARHRRRGTSEGPPCIVSPS